MVANNPWPHLISTVVRAVAMLFTAIHPLLLAEMVTSTDDKGRALTYLLLLLGTGAIHTVLWTACDFYVSAKVMPQAYELKQIAFEAVWDRDYRAFVDHPSGKVASYINDLRGQADTLWDTIHYSFLPMAVSIPVYVYLLVRSSAANAIGYLGFLVVAGVVLTIMARPVNARRKHLTDTTSTNNGRVFDSLSNFVNVFSFRAQTKEKSRNRRELAGVSADNVRFSYALSGYWGVAAAMVRLGLWTSVMGYSWYLYDAGRIEFVAFVVSVTVLLDFTSEYWELVFHYGSWVENSAAYREAYNYLFPGQNIVADHYRSASGSVEGDDDIGRQGAGLRDRIEIDHLSFAYPDDPDRLVLDDVTFTVGRGEKVGIVGRSGEGKSTLIKILLGFYAPTSGRVLVDGVEADAERLNRLQSYVPQDTSLFQETVGYNIAYAEADEPSPERIVDAAARANIDDFIQSLPAGYETLVGERGIKLSLGQRQRIAIARAFLKPADLLILDEATSSLDSETEAFIQLALENLWQDRAAIIIAHRLATLNDVDRIVVIENGRVVQEGSKADLLATGGPFADLWDRQRAGVA